MKELPVQLQATIKIEQLSTLPAVLVKLINLLNDSNASFDDIADLIKMDVALSAKMLSVANSALYAQWGKVENINRVLVVLGLENVKRIAMTACIKEFFSSIEPNKESLKQQLWVNSLHCAYLAQHIAKITGYHNTDITYLSGLLHRLGQFVFLHSFHQDYIEKVLVSDKLEEQLANERKYYGWTQAELGSWLIEQWQLDPILADAVLYQTEADDAIDDAHLIIKFINFSSKLIRNPDSDSLSLLAKSLFGLSDEMMQRIFDQSREEVLIGVKTFGFSSDSKESSIEELEKQRIGLAKIVHNNALLENSRLPIQQFTEIEDLLIATQKNLTIVFGISKSCFFLSDSDGYLKGWEDRNLNNKISKIKLSIKNRHSLISRCLADKTSYNSANSPEKIISVVDQQIIRALSSDQIVVFPLITKDVILGALVLGFHENDQALSNKQLQLISVFSVEIANNLTKLTELNQERKNLQQAAQAEFSLKIRKIVHEVNNPLSIMKNYLHSLSIKLDQDHPAKNELDLITNEVQRVGDMLLHFSQSSQLFNETDSGRLDINELITNICKLFESSLFKTRDIKVEYHLTDQLPTLDIDAAKLKQVLINLLKNAAEAIVQNGVIRIYSAGNLLINKKSYLEIKIQDNGPGISQDIIKNLFSPVVSTKGKEHSGLGLTITDNLIKEMNGKIHCRTSLKGTEFQILLPIET